MIRWLLKRLCRWRGYHESSVQVRVLQAKVTKAAINGVPCEILADFAIGITQPGWWAVKPCRCGKQHPEGYTRALDGLTPTRMRWGGGL